MITSLYAGLAGLLLIFLTRQVVQKRIAHKVLLNDGGEMELQQRIRAQANFLEYTPIFLIMLALAEYNGLVVWAVHALGIVFLLGRVSHSYAFLKDEKIEKGKIVAVSPWRIRSMQITFLSLAVMSVILLVQFIV